MSRVEIGRAVLHRGDSRDVLASMGEASVDAVVCDPPYELGFMGKAWDASGIAYDLGLWSGVLRVLKPGGHLLAFGGTRTYHRMACAIEDAGFEIRDQLQWLYGSGFPKSLDVSKALDKGEGIWRGRAGVVASGNGAMAGPNYERTPKGDPATPAARQWDGWGTALKPANEPIVLARKPLAGTVAANVLEHGTGALNIDGCRIAADDALVRPPILRTDNAVLGRGLGAGVQAEPAGRWPANVLLDEEAARLVDEQSGILTSGSRKAGVRTGLGYHGASGDGGPAVVGGEGGASRFFYVAKPASAERHIGGEVENTHATVKPIELMEHLIRLVTPPGGIVLDPFMGSGTTGIAALNGGWRFCGIELLPDHFAIAERRIAVATAQGNLFHMDGAA
jgi:DNA modification methylase